MHVQSCCFGYKTICFFWRFRRRPRRWILKSLVLATTTARAIGLLSKTISLRVHHAFFYISSPLLHDYDVKMPSFTFSGGLKQAITNFSFSF